MKYSIKRLIKVSLNIAHKWDNYDWGFIKDQYKSVVLIDELHIFLEGNSAAVVFVDLCEIPVDHFLSNLYFQRFERIFHKFSELGLINQLLFAFLFVILQ